MSTFDAEVQQGRRFEFGKNWRSFLSTLTDERIREAERSLRDMLGVDDLVGKRFLDIGSGSGLFSLAARKLGAEVHSFDYDPESVECTKELRSRYFPDDPCWTVEEGSVLDGDYLGTLGSYDVVYSWGVLHHTGEMWAAVENAAALTGKAGRVFIAIYNDQGVVSRLWKKVKEFYCSGILGRVLVSAVFLPYFFSRFLILSLLERENAFSSYRKNRGMSITHDWFDWLGGLPFEVASVEKIFRFFRDRGFVLENIETTNGLANNQFVFARESDGEAAVADGSAPGGGEPRIGPDRQPQTPPVEP